MTNPNDPAFSTVIEADSHDILNPHCIGLTKREYFAAMAMQGMLSNPSYRTDCDKIAEWSLQNSDALIKELSKNV